MSKYYDALALKGLGQDKEATDSMTQLAEDPARGRTSAENYYVAGLAERHRERRQQVNAYFQKALEINPSLWQAQIELK